MIIAVNARVLNERQGGPARYTLNVIRELSRIDRRNRYIILLYDAIELGFDLPENFSIKIVPLRSKLFFDYIYLPLFSWLNRIDIFLFPKNTFSPLVRGKKIPVYHDIVYFEDLDFREFRFFDNLHHRIMIPVASKCSWRDLTVSDFTASRMRELLGIQPEKIRVVKEGVEDRFRIITDKTILSETERAFGLIRPFFFYAGSLSPRKNMAAVLRAFVSIRDSIPHRIYVTGGESWRDSDVHRIIEENNLEERVIKLGYIDDEDLVRVYNLADCYLYPSLYEGFGLPILEAQACGCPIIAAKSTSIPEVAGDGALFVDPRDDKDLARAMTRIVTDGALRRKIIAAGKKNCRRYSWETTARGILELFTESDG